MRMKSLRVLRTYMNNGIQQYVIDTESRNILLVRAQTPYSTRILHRHFILLSINIHSTVDKKNEMRMRMSMGERKKGQKIALSQSIISKCNEMPHLIGNRCAVTYVFAAPVQRLAEKHTVNATYSTLHMLQKVIKLLYTQIHQTQFPFISLTSIRPKASETKII